MMPLVLSDMERVRYVGKERSREIRTWAERTSKYGVNEVVRVDMAG